MTPDNLDLADLASMTDRLQTFHVTRHGEGVTTTILELENSDRTLPMPEDGETVEVFLDEPGAEAFVTFVAIGDTLRIAHTALDPAAALPHPLADIECMGGVQ